MNHIYHNIHNLKNKAKNLLIDILKDYTTKEKLDRFISKNIPLNEIGICTGITTLIDKKLQYLHPELCILSSDTITKFLSDIERDFRFSKPLNE